jgi:SAM-dependent methyltransferase
MYRVVAERCKRHFEKGDLAGLRTDLCETTKYRFVIEAVEQIGRGTRLLEIGCARGHLSSYFILAGYPFTGVDLSKEAVNCANKSFGNHFVEVGSATIEANAPYDVIYHTGTIGCVGDPIGLTESLLGLLKPGGRLVFNAPNADRCYLRGQLWLDEAPPPDVVTLFRSGFWRRQFSDRAEVNETVEIERPGRSTAIGLQKLCRRRWHAPARRVLESSGRTGSNGTASQNGVGDRLWRLFERGVVKVGIVTRLSKLLPSQPTPFGLFVTMTKK